MVDENLNYTSLHQISKPVVSILNKLVESSSPNLRKKANLWSYYLSKVINLGLKFSRLMLGIVD